MHPRRQAAHHVGPCGIWVVDGFSFVAPRAHVAIFDVTAMRVAVVPILIPLVGRGMHKPMATALLALVQGWLLWIAAIAIEAAAASASAVVPAVVVMLLWGIVDVVGWRLLLSDGHAELLKPCQLCLDGS